MDSQTLVAIAIIVFVAVSVSFAIGMFLFLRRLGSNQEDWTGQSDQRRPSPLPSVNSIGETEWEGQFPDGFEKPSSMDDSSELERRLKREIRELERAGYEQHLVRLPTQKGDAYCVTVSGSLPTKGGTANLYLECDDDFPSAPPHVYAEVLNAAQFDQYGQAEAREVELQPLQVIQKWDQQSSSLSSVAQEAFIQLDESYRPTSQLSGFLNKYGELVRSSND